MEVQSEGWNERTQERGGGRKTGSLLSDALAAACCEQAPSTAASSLVGLAQRGATGLSAKLRCQVALH